MRIIWSGLLMLLLALACSPPVTPVAVPTVGSVPTSAFTRTPTNTPTPAVQPSVPEPMSSGEAAITVGAARFRVELADTPERRTLGLSGQPELDPGTGLLFVFDSEDRWVFWMREMRFPLDFVWIDSGCTVADISQDVPEPLAGTDTNDLPRYQPEVPVRYVLEINAGEIESAGISQGDPVSFGGSLTGLYGC